jgi:uncharacterized protein (TIGR02598 family)
MSSQTARCSSSTGFSLIEVVMAIGLAMFSLLVIFSLIPTGLNSLQETNRQFVETEILNTVSAELGSTSYKELDDFVNQRFPMYFDNEGAETENATEAIFTVRCRLEAPELGGGELRRARVFIGFRREPELKDLPVNHPSTRQRALWLADRGQ